MPSGRTDPTRGRFGWTAGVNSALMEGESVARNPSPPSSKLTTGQKLMIAGLFFLQIPSSLIFYPLAAIFAITGIFVPIAMMLSLIGTMPFSFAMQYKRRWQGGEIRESPTVVG